MMSFETRERLAEESIKGHHFYNKYCPKSLDIPELFTSKWAMSVYDAARDEMTVDYGVTYVNETETEVIAAFRKYGFSITPFINDLVQIREPEEK